MNTTFYELVANYRVTERKVKNAGKDLINQYLNEYPAEVFQDLPSKASSGDISDILNVEVYNSFTDTYENVPLISVEKLPTETDFVINTETTSYVGSAIRHTQTIIDVVLLMEDCIAFHNGYTEDDEK